MEYLSIHQCVGKHTFAVHGGADAADTACGIDLADLAVARLLHGISFIPSQQLDQQIVQEVRSGAHQNILRIHLKPPEAGQMVGDRLPQFPNALIGHGQQQLFPVVQHHLPLQLRPHREGKTDGTAAGEIQQRRRLRGGDRDGCLLPGQALQILHKVANLFPGGDVALA